MRKRVTSASWLGGYVIAVLVFSSLAIGWASPARAVQQVYEVDSAQSTFSAGSIDVGFIAVADTSTVGPQVTVGGTSIDAVSWAPTGSVTVVAAATDQIEYSASALLSRQML